MSDLRQSDVGPVKKMLLKHARDAFIDETTIDSHWKELGYLERPDFDNAVREYDNFVAALKGFDIDVCFLPADGRVGIDSIYVRDVTISCRHGLVLCNMGKPQRKTEPRAQQDSFEGLGLHVHGRIEGEGRIEGGDVVWLGERTLAVGRGYRTNDEGIRQVEKLLSDCIDELIVVPLPHWRGAGDVFHLMSMLSPIDHDLALVYSPLLPVPFREALVRRGMEFVEVPASEFETMGCNVLTVAPRRCLMLAGNPVTRSRLEKAGAVVEEFQGCEISTKGCGGPTCLTRPLEWR